MLTFLALGAGIGFVAGVSPGPVLTLVVTETLRGVAARRGPSRPDRYCGWTDHRRRRRGAGAIAGGYVPAVSLVGGLFLLYMAITTGLKARRASALVGQRVSVRDGLGTGLLARGLSPHPSLFWFLVRGPLLIEARHAE